MIVGQVKGERGMYVRTDTQTLPGGWNAESRRVLFRACANCHSDHTEWPWYSRVAPISWWIERHVREGRENLDFSEWETYSAAQKRDSLDSICGLISTGRMPPRLYTFMHPEAKLSAKDIDAVCDWVKTERIGAR